MGRKVADVGKYNSVGEAEVIVLNRGTPIGVTGTQHAVHIHPWVLQRE